jgi:hypothetical protein
LIRSRRNLESLLLLKRGHSHQIQDSLAPIGAVERVIVVSRKGAISRTTGRKVVVRGRGILAKEKGRTTAKAMVEEKEKEMQRAKGEEDEEGHLDTPQ